MKFIKTVSSKGLLISMITGSVMLLGLNCIKIGHPTQIHLQSNPNLKSANPQLANFLIKPAFADNQLIAQSNSVLTRLIGRWEDSSGSGAMFIFTQEGRFFMVYPPSSNGARVAQQLWYSIISTVRPMQLNIIEPIMETRVMAIFEFTDDGQLRISSNNQERPVDFSSNVTFFRKVSDQATLPTNTTISHSVANGIQSEAKTYLGSMIRGQQTFYLENNRFATTIDQLGTGLSASTDFYRYQIIPRNNLSSSVMITASAKKGGTRSYTAAVFAINNTTVGIMCQTNQPSASPPNMPILYNGQPQCASGSSEVR